MDEDLYVYVGDILLKENVSIVFVVTENPNGNWSLPIVNHINALIDILLRKVHKEVSPMMYFRNERLHLEYFISGDLSNKHYINIKCDKFLEND